MPFKRLRKASDDTGQQSLSRATDKNLSTVSAELVSKTRRASAADEANGVDASASLTASACVGDPQIVHKARHTAKQQTVSGISPTLDLASGKQQPKADARTSKHASIVQLRENPAALSQPEEPESQEPLPELSAIQSDSGAQSDDEENFEEREDDRANDPACIQCDDGGDIMFCDGSCMRAFHCGVEKVALDDCTSGSDQDDESAPDHTRTKLQAFHCNPLDMPLDLYWHLKDTKDTFHCPNCLAGVHQCFKCKQEGVVETHAADSLNARFAKELVFRCGVAACGRYYHASCINQSQEDMQAAFLCPLHTCKRCGGSESDSNKGELVPCRRCPKAYHEHCMPAPLLDTCIPGKNRVQRIWIAQFKDGKCISEVERSLIYCGSHKIPDGCNNPMHQRAVFHQALLQRWKIHFAHLFTKLASSRKLAQKVEETENRPLGSRLKQMSGSLRNHSHQQPSRSGGSSPTTSEAAAPSQVGLKRQRSVQQGTGRKQAAAVPAAAQLKLSQPKAVQGASTKAKPPQSALKQSVPKVKGTPAPASSVLPTSAKQGELSLAEAKALARSIRAQRQAGVVPPASAAATAVLGNADESLAPVRKHPALPDRSMLPPKKRRAVEGAVPEAEQQPSAGSQELQAGTIASEPGSTATTRKAVGIPPLPPQPKRQKHPLARTSSWGSEQSASKHEQAQALNSQAATSSAPATTSAAAGSQAAALPPSVPADAAVTAQSQAAGQPSTVQPGLHAQYVGEYTEQHDEGDVDILGGSVPAPADLATHAEPAAAAPVAAAEAASEAVGTKASGEGAVGAKPVSVGADTPATAVNAPVQDVARPLPPRTFELTTEYARRLQAMSLKERKAEAKQRVEQIMQACKAAGRVTLEKVIQNTRQPEPYKHPSKMTVTEERLSVIERAVAAAEKEKDPKRASQWVNASIAKEMLMHEDNLSMVLAPFLHGKRYSSYGRHFTKQVLLQRVAQMLTFYLLDNDTLVDFSCGANAFVPLVKQEGRKQGLTILGCSFDIITSQNLEDFKRCSWMDVRPGDLPHGDKLVIGLNPPFGKNNMLADMFVRHAAKFCPRVIVLIVPPGVPIPPGYQVTYEEQETMRDRAFFVPGSKNDSWNQVPPALRVLVRQEWVHHGPANGTGWHHTAIAPMYGARCRPRQPFPGPPVHPAMPQHPGPPQHLLWQPLPHHHLSLQHQQHFQFHEQPPTFVQQQAQQHHMQLQQQQQVQQQFAQQQQVQQQVAQQQQQQLLLLTQHHRYAQQAQHAQQLQQGQQQVSGLHGVPEMPPPPPSPPPPG